MEGVCVLTCGDPELWHRIWCGVGVPWALTGRGEGGELWDQGLSDMNGTGVVVILLSLGDGYMCWTLARDGIWVMLVLPNSVVWQRRSYQAIVVMVWWPCLVTCLYYYPSSFGMILGNTIHHSIHWLHHLLLRSNIGMILPFLFFLVYYLTFEYIGTYTALVFSSSSYQFSTNTSHQLYQ